MPSQYGFQILAPCQSPLTSRFRKIEDGSRHSGILRALQRLRGQIYLEDEAIASQDIDGDGRFRMYGDEEAWHLVLSDANERVIGCVRYLVYSNTTSFESLKLRQSALAKDPRWSGKLKAAIEKDLRQARERNHSYIEIGGWAISPEWRCTRAALEIAVGSYALASLWGGAIGACSATFRHESASILRRLGGEKLESEGVFLPSYYDPQYGCMMEILRFDYLTPDARFYTLLKQLTQRLADSPLIVREPATIFKNSLLALMRQTQLAKAVSAGGGAIDSVADEEAICHPGILGVAAYGGTVPGSPA